MTPAEWAFGAAIILAALVLSLRKPLYRWADARRARRTAFKEENDHDDE